VCCCSVLQCVAVCCSVLQCAILSYFHHSIQLHLESLHQLVFKTRHKCDKLCRVALTLSTATRCNTLQHTATHCNALQRTATTHSIHFRSHLSTLIERTPSPPGEFPIHYVPSSRTVSTRTPLDEFVPGASRGVLLLTDLDEGT